jgi:hypothetical protein
MTLLPAKNYPINCGSPTTNFNSRRFNKTKISEIPYNIDITSDLVELAGNSSGSQTFKDRVYSYKASASFKSKYLLSITEKNINNTASTISLTTDSSSISLVKTSDTLWVCNYVSDGMAKIVATNSLGVKRILNVQSFSTNSSYAYSFTNYATGSLAQHLVQILSRLNNNPSLPIFSTQNPATQEYIRNSNCWVNDIDFTSKGVWNTSGGFGMGGCLLTRKHMIFTSHSNYFPSVGSQIHFAEKSAATNQKEPIYIGTVVNVSNSISGDKRLIRLSSDVPSVISPAKILPSNFSSYFPNQRIGDNCNCVSGDGDLSIPAVWIDQNNVARLRLISINRDDSFYQKSSTAYASYSQYAPSAVAGDSGSPIYLIINGSAVFLSNHTGPEFGYCLIRHQDEYPYYSIIQQIKNQITAWGDSHTISTVDLSSFNSY